MDLKLFTDDWKEFLHLANCHRLRYLVVGGVAVNYYGYVRSTADIDIWIANTSANMVRLKKCMRDFGFGQQAQTIPAKLGKRDVIFMGKAPFRIDILSGISGVTFAAAYRRKVIMKLNEMSIPVIHLKDLIANKRASGRIKDQADVEVLGRLM
ncbi:MAG TPA: hypothetical protein PLX97_09625 [Gemmatales bacterium]|nr:hypothetical protein [Gemmatales bacterium]